jgi:hypothetical protein
MWRNKAIRWKIDDTSEYEANEVYQIAIANGKVSCAVF